MTPEEFGDACKEALVVAGHGVERMQLIGSALYLPPEQAADADFAVLITASKSPYTFAAELFRDHGYQGCSEYDKAIGEDTFWTAVRREHVNLMITNNAEWFERYLLAMQVCRYLKLTEKRQRIGVCRLVRDGKSVDEVLAFEANDDR